MKKIGEESDNGHLYKVLKGIANKTIRKVNKIF